MTTPPMAESSTSVPPVDDDWVDEDDDEPDTTVYDKTYGEKAAFHLSTRQLKVGQIRTLQPKVPDYLRTQGSERTSFVQKAFQEIWDGDAVDWAAPSTWPKRRDSQFRLTYQAVRNFFSERGRVRDVVVKLPGKGRSKTSWTAISVVNQVYRSAIHDLVFDVSGLKPQKKGEKEPSPGWLTEYNKACVAIYHTLSADERAEMEQLAMQWTRTGIPLYMKKKNYTRSCKKFLLNVADTCLKRYGIYPFFFIVGEPGSDIKANIMDFGRELGLGNQRFEDDTTSNTLERLQLFVKRNAGMQNVQEQPARKVTAKFKDITSYSIPNERLVGHDELKIDTSDFVFNALASEAKSVLYNMFRYAHANISDRPPAQLDVPWLAIKQGQLLDNKKYFPPDWVHNDVTQAPGARCLEFIHRLRDIGDLCFHHWLVRNGAPREPVEHKYRWWYSENVNSNAPVTTPAEEEARARALAARPVYTATEATARNNLPPTAGPSSPAGPSIAAEVDARLSSAAKMKRPDRRSPYGSAGVTSYHSGFLREDDIVFDGDGAEHSPDPDDLLPPGASCMDLQVPCSVPRNPEALAQWSHAQVLRVEDDIPTGSLRACITTLCELPLVHNHFYPARNFRKSASQLKIPQTLTWDARSMAHLVNTDSMDVVGHFLRSSPWTFVYKGQTLFVGIEMAWLIILAFLLYGYGLPLLTSEPPVSYDELSTITGAFKSFLRATRTAFNYPTHGPSIKYAIARSREGYLYTCLQHVDGLVRLLKLTMRLPVAQIDVASTIDSGANFPSWQSPRGGMPDSMHSDPDIVSTLTTWFEGPRRLVHPDGLHPVSQEEGLLVLLKVTLILSDLQALQREDWDAQGVLQGSHLRFSELILTLLIEEWAEREVDTLESALGEVGASGSLDQSAGFIGDVPGASGWDAATGTGWTEFGGVAAGGPAGAGDYAPGGSGERTPGGYVAQEPAGSRVDVEVVSGTSGTSAPSAAYNHATPQHVPVGRSLTHHRTGPGKTLPDPTYLKAAQDLLINEHYIQANIAKVARIPANPHEERTMIALEVQMRAKEDAQRNAKILADARHENLALYGTSHRPPPPKAPTMSQLPELPPIAPDVAQQPIPESTVPKKRRKAGPTVIQDMAKVPRTRKAATKKVKAVGTPAVRGRKPLAKEKRPLATSRKRLEEPDSDSADETDLDAEPHSAEPSVNPVNMAVTPAPAGFNGRGPSATAEPEPRLTRSRSSKRPRADTIQPGTELAHRPSTPVTQHHHPTQPTSPSSRPPVSKRLRVEVMMPRPRSARTTQTANVPAVTRPKPRMIRHRKRNMDESEASIPKDS
ncbi:unnamed protein product [Peniophora sp. CBMAI 1063]|nr:unnamed protein product [Peniophora sp. CBMAI 1063]